HPRGRAARLAPSAFLGTLALDGCPTDAAPPLRGGYARPGTSPPGGEGSVRVLAVAALAVLGLTAYAVAQSPTTTFKVGGTVSVHGGTKAKPKPGGLSFTFDVSDPSGNQTPPVQTYQIMYEGGRLNTTLIPGCPAAKINAPNTPTTDLC